jgi:predicted lipid-binding transport protein (Tim44 family)
MGSVDCQETLALGAYWRRGLTRAAFARNLAGPGALRKVAQRVIPYYLSSNGDVPATWSSIVSREMVEILVLAAIAGLVVARLYSVLGRKTGAEPPAHRTATVEAGAPAGAAGPIPVPAPAPTVSGPAAEAVRADPSFDPARFIVGAKAAYEIIVQAYATGDRDALRPLLTPRVFATYDKAIDDRQAAGGVGPELVRLKSADIIDSSVAGETLRVAVRFEAELAEGASGIRETRERWTFEREIRSSDPTWLLSSVAQA